MDVSPSSGLPAPLAAFLSRFDAYCAATGEPGPRVSRWLFGDDGRIEQIRNSSSDTGVKRLARAEADLAKLAEVAGITLPEGEAADESESAAARPRATSEAAQ